MTNYPWIFCERGRIGQVSRRIFIWILGLSKQQLGTLIRKGKQLIKSGVITESEFREVKIDSASPPCVSSITMRWDKGKVIRFPDVDHLHELLL